MLPPGSYTPVAAVKIARAASPRRSCTPPKVRCAMDVGRCHTASSVRNAAWSFGRDCQNLSTSSLLRSVPVTAAPLRVRW